MPKTTSYTKDRGQNTKQTSFKTETAQDNLGTLCEHENCVSQIHFLFVNFQIKRSLKKTRARSNECISDMSNTQIEAEAAENIKNKI